MRGREGREGIRGSVKKINLFVRIKKINLLFGIKK